MTSHISGHHARWSGQTQTFGAVEVVATTPRVAAEQLCQLAVDKSTPGRHIHLVNAYTLSLAENDSGYSELLASGGLCLPDGKPLAIFSHLMRQSPRLEQVRGPQLFLDVFDVGRQHTLRHYLLGSSPVVLAKLEQELTRRFPGCVIVGLESPPYRPLTQDEFEAQDRRIQKAQPDIVWIGLGTPKQDREASRLTRATGITTIAVGAAFDFVAGEVREAPQWMTRWSLEWLFRLATEPRRLWRRYLFGNVKFLLIAIRCWIETEKSRRAAE